MCHPADKQTNKQTSKQPLHLSLWKHNCCDGGKEATWERQRRLKHGGYKQMFYTWSQVKNIESDRFKSGVCWVLIRWQTKTTIIFFSWCCLFTSVILNQWFRHVGPEMITGAEKSLKNKSSNRNYVYFLGSSLIFASFMLNALKFDLFRTQKRLK